MRRASSPRRRLRALKRIASATALAVSAALLAMPGTAAAQPADTTAPTFVDVSFDEATHRVGDEVDVDITVADEGFPDGSNTLTIHCMSGAVCNNTLSIGLTTTTTTTWRIRVTSTADSVVFRVTDSAGNEGYSDALDIPATHSHFDFNGDGGQDLMGVDESGRLMYYAGGDVWYWNGHERATGWGGMDFVMAGDLTGDGHRDLLARDTKTGYLYTYPGYYSELEPRIQVGGGWNGMSLLTSAADFNADGKLDLLAVRKSDGTLFLYPGRGDGTFGSRTAIDDGWNAMDLLTTIDDVDRDGRQEVLARDSRTGGYRIYFGSPASLFGERIAYLEPSLGGDGSRRYDQVVGVGDVDGDNVGDVVAIDSRTGEQVLHSFDVDGSPLHTGQVIGADWGGIQLPVTVSDRTYDYNGDDSTDVIARRTSNQTLYFYPGSGTGTLGAAQSMGSGWDETNLFETAGDFNGDGFADFLARSTIGTLYVYPGDGAGGYFSAERVTVGSGWNTMSVIAAGHDYDGDGKADIIGQERSSGYLWFYPGTGTGKHGTRQQVGSGWNAMREMTAVGDLDHDGNADIVAIRSSDNCLFFYGGNGNGTFKARVQIGCGWAGYNALTGIGDFDRDGHADLIARRASDGALFYYKGDGKGDFTTRGQVGTGWNAMNIA